MAEQSSTPRNIGDYEIVKELGRGGMGVVYLAIQKGLSRNVALKMMLPVERDVRLDLQQQAEKELRAKQRFSREAKAIATLRSDHIIQIFDIRDWNGTPYFVMEFLEGQSLESYLEYNSQPRLNEILRIAQEAAQGLADAHDAGIIHRDLKPENLFLEGPKKRIKLLDFGLARQEESASTLTYVGAVMGTTGYMAPEQANGEPVDARTDLFSFGVILHRLCTGEMPFPFQSFPQFVYALGTLNPESVRVANPSIPKPLSRLIDRLLEKHPDDRPQSIHEVLAVLDTLSGNQETLDLQPENRVKSSLPPTARSLDLRDLPPVRRETRREPHTEENFPLLPSPGLPWGLITFVGGGIFLVMVLVVVLLTSNSNSTPEKKKEVVENFRKGEDLQSDLVKVEPRVEPKIVSPLVKGKEKEKPRFLDGTSSKGVLARTVKASQQEWAEYLGIKVNEMIDLGAGVKMEFVLIPPGKFMMGSSEEDLATYLKMDRSLKREYIDPEQPQHEVIVSKPFYLGRYEVTQEEFMRLSKLPNPSFFKKDANSKRYPVESITWVQAKNYTDQLTQLPLPKEVKSASLPTEAQWEYACRAGTRTSFHFGDAIIGKEANCDPVSLLGSPDKTPVSRSPVAVDHPDYKPNAFGLSHMHGNVWEWCLDGWDAKAYARGKVIDPLVKQLDQRHCLRGGSWNDFSWDRRSADRIWFNADYRHYCIGFRVVLSLD